MKKFHFHRYEVEVRFFVVLLVLFMVVLNQGFILLFDRMVADAQAEVTKQLSVLGHWADTIISRELDRNTTALEDLDVRDLQRLNVLIADLQEGVPEARIVLLDSNGAVLLPRGRPGHPVLIRPVTLTYEQRESLKQGGVVLRDAAGGSSGMDRQVLLKALKADGRHVGLLRVDLEPVRLRELRLLGPRISLLRSATILVALILSLIYIRHVLLPFRLISQKAKTFFHARGRDLLPGARGDVEYVVRSFELTITELEEKERQLAALLDQERGRLRDVQDFSDFILRSIPLGVITIDRFGAVTTVNAAAANLLGTGANPARGIPAEKLLAQFPELLTLADSTAMPLLSDAPVPLTIHAGGQIVHLDAQRCLLRGPAGEQLGMALLLADTTKRREMEEHLRLKKRVEELGEMAAGIAHELRNPLGALLGFVRLLERRLPPGHELGEYLEEMRQAVHGMNKIVTDFLDYVRPAAPQRSATGLDDLLREVAGQVRQTEHQQVRLQLQLMSGSQVPADRGMLATAMANVIRNAFQFSPPDGAVTIRSHRQPRELAGTGDECVIQVIDNGPGIKDEHFDSLFRPFFTTRPNGTGLGLAIAQKVILAHGGAISAANVPGGGAAFIIRLPAM